MSFVFPERSAHDLHFTVGRIPVRVTPWFWLVQGGIGALFTIPFFLLMARFEGMGRVGTALLERTLKHDRVYDKRISWDCISFGTEETTDAYFGFVVREIHNAKCGGAPEVSPVVDRYRIYRRSGKIERWQPTDDAWQSYKPVPFR